MHELRDSFGTWVYETYGVKQAQEWVEAAEVKAAEDALPARDNVVSLAARRQEAGVAGASCLEAARSGILFSDEDPCPHARESR
jgi:hypothetical protein